MTEDELKNFSLDQINEDEGGWGYILCVDLEYPEAIQDRHRCARRESFTVPPPVFCILPL